MIVEKLVTGDRRLEVLEIATEVGVSYGIILNILLEHFGLSKVRARWAPMFSGTRSEVISGGNMFGAVGYL